MNQSKNLGTSHNPTFSRAIKEEVLQYFLDQGGEVKETAVYIHFVLEHHEEIPQILEEFTKDDFIQHKDGGHMILTKKGRKALLRLQELRAR